MQNNTTKKARILMVVLLIIVGILLLTVLPTSVMNAMDTVIKGAYSKYEILKLPAIIAAPNMVKIFYPLWTGLSMVAGAAVLLLTVPIYRGERWGRPLALGALAIPCITGAYILGPITYFAKEAIMTSVSYMLISLVSYFVILLAEQTSIITKIKNFIFFALLGVTIAYNFANGHSSLRQQWSALLQDPQAMDHAYVLGVVAAWVGVVITLIGLPLLAGRTNVGWWVTTVGTAAMLVGVLQFFAGHTSTTEFWVGSTMCIVTLALLVIPSVGGSLVDKPAGQKQFLPTLEQVNNINM